MIKSSESELEARALVQFDALVKKGEIFWEETEEIKIEQYPFDVYFRVSPITLSKPYNPDNKSRKPGFQDDDPDFTLCTIKPNHKLILNKYCWLRPQLILHTVDFESQIDLLNQTDFEAAVDVLEQLGSRYMVIFNGGPDAGSSVAHKHLQVFPRPEWPTFADELVAGRKMKIPFRHRIGKLDSSLQPDQIFKSYQSMCKEMSIENGVAHSLIFVREWLLVFPRSCATISGQIEDALMQGGANAMIGMLWVKKNEQLENWENYGPMKVLTEFGVTAGEEPTQQDPERAEENQR